MSCTTLLGYKNAQFIELRQYPNAWGSAARIWGALYDQYLKNPAKRYDCWLVCRPFDRLFDLAAQPNLELYERAVHTSTLDRAYVRRENFGRFIADLKAFNSRYPAGHGANHLPRWAQDIASVGEDVEAISFHQTSVAGNPWIRQINEEGDSVQRPLSDGFEVYDFVLGKLTKPEPDGTVDGDEHKYNPNVVEEVRQTSEPVLEAFSRSGEGRSAPALG